MHSNVKPEPLVDLELAAGILDRVLVGVDTSPESAEAVRQAERLREPGGSIAVATILDYGVTAQAGWAATSAAAQLRTEAEAALDAVRGDAPEASFRLVEGRADQTLVAEADRSDATLLAVGTHGLSRTVGIALGSVATTALHEAPCSVLVARASAHEEPFPRSIVIGVDGSDESAAAAALGFRLARRFGIEAWPVAVRKGKEFDIAAIDAIAEGVRLEDGDPVDLLVSLSAEADLLVVGSRGLKGLRSLGSVSERVAHRAPCSVLVVRPPAAP